MNTGVFVVVAVACLFGFVRFPATAGCTRKHSSQIRIRDRPPVYGLQKNSE
jgi:hypothetical protein